MPTPPTIDFDKLLTPITSEAPAGALSDKSDPASDYYRVKTLRDAASQVEESLYRALVLGDPLEGIGKPDWQAVVKAGADIIKSVSKDLRIACWTAEGLIRTNGVAGLRDGLDLCFNLCQTFWSTINPRPDDEGHADSVAMFRVLAGEATRREISRFPITAAIDGRSYTLMDYRLLSEGGEGAGGLAELNQAVGATDAQVYRDLLEDLERTTLTLERLIEFLDENCQPDSYGQATAPLLSPLADELNELVRVIQSVARPHLGAGDQGDLAGNVDSGSGAEGVAAPASGGIRNRQDAFRVLDGIASYFERVEPHSPIPYALRQVIRWGKMSLPELLADLIHDQGVREDLNRRVGVPFAQDGND